MRMRVRGVAAFLIAGCFALCAPSASAVAQQSSRQRWTEAEAQAWYGRQPWLVGANFVPSDAINQLEMFQAATFNPELIDRELGLGESMGMNTMRIFLQDQLWQQDAAGFRQRVETVLSISQKHGIRPILVLFDSCWEDNPKLGPQHPPIPGIHNSGWVQSPGLARLSDPTIEPQLRAYVTGIVGAFARDPRVLAWDIWNEPYTADEKGSLESRVRSDRVGELLTKAFDWARSANPTQPLTSGLFHGDFIHPERENKIVKIQLAESDVISFHKYDWPEKFEATIVELQRYHRPLICTEYMARSAGSTFDSTLPIAKKYNVAAINWGLVAGKTQTYYPWDSWQRPYVLSQPTVWFHDVFRVDGTPYRQAEYDLMRQLTGRGLPGSPSALPVSPHTP